MTRPDPPRLAVWLLHRFGAGRHRDAIAGDLLEQYAEGRSRWWFWRQAVSAMLIGRAACDRRRLGIRMQRLACHRVIEATVLLGLVVTVEQLRRSPEAVDLWDGPFLATLGALCSLALLATVVLRRARPSPRTPSGLSRVMMLLVLTAVGAGTLTWAGTIRSLRHPTARVCPLPAPLADRRP